MSREIDLASESWYEPNMYLCFCPLDTDTKSNQTLLQVVWYILQCQFLYRKNLDGVFSHYLTLDQAQMTLEHCHSMVFRGHVFVKTIVEIVLYIGYYWPFLHRDAYLLAF